MGKGQRRLLIAESVFLFFMAWEFLGFLSHEYFFGMMASAVVAGTSLVITGLIYLALRPLVTASAESSQSLP